MSMINDAATAWSLSSINNSCEGPLGRACLRYELLRCPPAVPACRVARNQSRRAVLPARLLILATARPPKSLSTQPSAQKLHATQEPVKMAEARKVEKKVESRLEKLEEEVLGSDLDTTDSPARYLGPSFPLFMNLS